MVKVLEGKGRGLFVVLRGNGRVASVSLHNYDQFSFHLVASIRSAKLVVVLEGYGRNSSFPPKTTTKPLPFTSRTTTKLHSFPYRTMSKEYKVLKYLNGHFFLKRGVYLKVLEVCF